MSSPDSTTSGTVGDAPVSSPSPAIPAAAATPAPAIREDQVQNAVAFLTHPKVRESPAATKRSFLERKGLTVAEIEEAFKRVPETSTTLQSPAQIGNTGLVTYQPQPGASSSSQQQTQPQQPQHASQVQQGQGQGAIVQAKPVPPQPEPMRWTQVVLGAGVIAAGVYAVRTMLLPYAQEWYKLWTEKSRAEQEARARQEAALLEAVEAMKACQNELRTSSKAMSDIAAAMREQQAQQAAFRALESSKAHSTEEIKRELQEIKAALKNKRRSSTGAHADVSSTSPPAYNTDYNSTNPYAWMDKMYGDTQQVIPPPPQGYLGMNRTAHQASDSDAAGTSSVPKAEASTTATTSAADSATADAAASGSSAQVERTVPADPPGGPVPYPPSFMEVMDMVAKGITPSNVRTDINDQPPDPTRSFTESNAPPKPKPWESAARNATPQGFPIQPAGASTEESAEGEPSLLACIQAEQQKLAVTPGGLNPRTVTELMGSATPWGPPPSHPANRGAASAMVDGDVEASNTAANPALSAMMTEIAPPPPPPPPVSVLTPNAAWKPPPPPARTIASSSTFASAAPVNIEASGLSGSGPSAADAAASSSAAVDSPVAIAREASLSNKSVVASS